MSQKGRGGVSGGLEKGGVVHSSRQRMVASRSAQWVGATHQGPASEVGSVALGDEGREAETSYSLDREFPPVAMRGGMLPQRRHRLRGVRVGEASNPGQATLEIGI